MGVLGIIIILVGHYVSDFLCQSRYHARRKSTSIKVLTEHVFIYSTMSLCFYISLVAAIIIMNNELLQLSTINGALMFYIITFVTHWITDFCTSRWTKYLFSQNKEWKFFAVIGFDQLIHVSTLLLTYEYILS
jgi:hypothetical protein